MNKWKYNLQQMEWEKAKTKLELWKEMQNGLTGAKYAWFLELKTRNTDESIR